MINENLEKIIKRIERLEKTVFRDKIVKKNTPKVENHEVNFSINERAYVKRYALDKSGPKKFTLLLAFLAEGEVDKNVELSEIKKNWDRMSAKNMLGKFNMFYPNDAKNRGWIDSTEYGKYNLTSEWKSIL